MRPHKSPFAELLSIDDQDLARLAVRDGAAFAELYHRHFLRVYRFQVAVSGNAADAQELTARTFTAALEELGSYRGKTSFVSWLFEIALNQAVLRNRSEKQEAPGAAVEGDADLPPEPLAGGRLRFAQLSQALDKLHPERAEALRLYLIAELNAAETAQALQISPDAAKARVLRGLRDLRAELPASTEAEG